MRELTLKTVTIKKNVDLGIPVDSKLDYRVQILQTVCMPPSETGPNGMQQSQGFSVEEMLAQDSLVEKLKATEYPELGVISVFIEEEEHKILLERLSKSRFMIHTSEVVDMIKHFQNPPKVDPNAIQ